MNLPNILAVDASAGVCSVALRYGRYEHCLVSRTPRAHAQEILPMMNVLLTEAKGSLQGIDAMAYGAGPGSFTGLRIALGFVQGLAFGLGCPVVPVCSLQALSVTYRQVHPESERIVSILDARMSELYWAEYVSDNDQWVTRQPPMLSSVETVQEYIESLSASDKASLHLVGPGVELLSSCEAIISSDKNCEPTASAVLELASHAYLAGGGIPVTDAELNYLRNSVSWNKRRRVRTQPI